MRHTRTASHGEARARSRHQHHNHQRAQSAQIDRPLAECDSQQRPCSGAEKDPPDCGGVAEENRALRHHLRSPSVAKNERCRASRRRRSKKPAALHPGKRESNAAVVSFLYSLGKKSRQALSVKRSVNFGIVIEINECVPTFAPSSNALSPGFQRLVVIATDIKVVSPWRQ